MKRYSENYQFTIDPKNEKELKKLKDLRQNIKETNEEFKAAKFDIRYKVAVRGRLGKNNPAAKKYAAFGVYVGKKWSRMIDLKDAVRWDIYVYPTEVN